MRYYIIYPIHERPTENNYKIIKVNEADEASFLEEYAGKIIASGGSLMEALLNFERSKHNQQQNKSPGSKSRIFSFN